MVVAQDLVECSSDGNIYYNINICADAPRSSAGNRVMMYPRDSSHNCAVSRVGLAWPIFYWLCRNDPHPLHIKCSAVAFSGSRASAT